ncbi:hypothetical protein SERLA73DRAFT_184922 [Serpula lacrymans var. lacrymans S7.3]|uniref:Uncharacterized protein n=2 Tax=Serpula lacrymans var. lacrymans TaxID=341189 RepID=F8Q3Q5_SERL3|nr:uncharacterized protein SERLADRAFT_473106 [Serpula lacrymans var. lacrymans S7.9]EGN96761.1 hypothetical protein SERLA73DRAFT_184922 [Serpula lacrymans var. lacrymans S7.3]EGO22367.1 hypothetical protein SERLADRAFT_473106 [Serpula lacrymans var. lacrymans S7.9]
MANSKAHPQAFLVFYPNTRIKAWSFYQPILALHHHWTFVSVLLSVFYSIAIYSTASGTAAHLYLYTAYPFSRLSQQAPSFTSHHFNHHGRKQH